MHRTLEKKKHKFALICRSACSFSFNYRNLLPIVARVCPPYDNIEQDDWSEVGTSHICALDYKNVPRQAFEAKLAIL